MQIKKIAPLIIMSLSFLAPIPTEAFQMPKTAERTNHLFARLTSQTKKEPNQILSRMQKIAHIPTVIVQGRWDAICLPEMAYQVHKSLQNSVLWIVPDGGHSSADPAISQSLAEATDLFIEQFKEERRQK